MGVAALSTLSIMSAVLTSRPPTISWTAAWAAAEATEALLLTDSAESCLANTAGAGGVADWGATSPNGFSDSVGAGTGAGEELSANGLDSRGGLVMEAGTGVGTSSLNGLASSAAAVTSAPAEMDPRCGVPTAEPPRGLNMVTGGVAAAGAASAKGLTSAPLPPVS